MLNETVLENCWQVMERNGLMPFDREGNRHFYWFISTELVEHEWRPDMTNEIAGIPVLLAPRGGSAVELLRWVDGANVMLDSPGPVVK